MKNQNIALDSPLRLGRLDLPNRVVMAPLTRCRADADTLAPVPLNAEYYAQRAGAGLIVGEGTPVSPRARGYAYSPGIYSAAQIAGWRLATDAVHESGGRIYAQLWHTGRVGHRSLRADASPPLAPSAQRLDMETFAFDAQGHPAAVPCDAPQPMTEADIRQTMDDFVQAAHNAVAAGFDGVEIHGANGYLFDQFRCPYVNDRRDAWGGPLENRCRLLVDTAAGIVEAIGAERVGVRLSPRGEAHGMRPDPDPLATYGYLARRFARLGLAYLHVYDQSASWIHDPGDSLLAALRAAYPGALILCGGFDAARARAALAAGSGDLIAFGKPYISNPDLAQRLVAGAPLAAWDADTFYGGGARGYTDYPPFEAHRRP